jgi:hypothetical protein
MSDVMMKPHKKEATGKTTPVCPRCGLTAIERETKYGIRSSCCDLWSWDRDPLVDKATHDARKYLGVLLRDLTKSIGATALIRQLKERTNIPVTDVVNPRKLNEVSCKKASAACENILMDILSGDVKPQALPKKFK